MAPFFLMQIRVNSNVLLEGHGWIEPGVGNFEPSLAEHLISLGAAEKMDAQPIQNKMLSVPENKESVAKKPVSSSQPAPRSRKRTAKKSSD